MEKDTSKSRSYYICQCDCGIIKSIRLDALKSGQSQSCGCYCVEQAIKNGKNQKRHTTHGLTHNIFYKLWWRVKDRCYNTNCKNYHNYGGRGIQLYSEWINDPVAFVKYVSELDNAGTDDWSLDRIDNNGNYEPNNLRWASKKTQGINRRTTKLSYEKAEEIRKLSENTSVTQISKIYNVDASTIYDVINNKLWSNQNE